MGKGSAELGGPRLYSLFLNTARERLHLSLRVVLSDAKHPLLRYDAEASGSISELPSLTFTGQDLQLAAARLAAAG